MKNTLLVLALVAVVVFAGCELFMPTVLVSGAVYTANYGSATLAQALETSSVYALVITSPNDTDLGGDTVADLDLSQLLSYRAASEEYTSPFWITQFDNEDYGPVSVSMSGSDYYRVLFVQDVDDNNQITSADAIVGASDTSLNVYSSGEETGTDSVTFYWDLVVTN